MASRYLGLSVLFLLAVLTPLLLDVRGGRDVPVEEELSGVPAEALEALRQGRFWRASRILRGYLAATPNPSPQTVLLAAQAEAGWGEWARVEALLAGRSWLDTLAGGYGWHLLGRSRLEQQRWAEGDAALRRYLEVATGAGDRERGLAEARRAAALAASGEGREAIASYDRAARLIPQLGDWMDILAADVAAQAGDTAEVMRRLEGKDRILARDWGWRIEMRARLNAHDLAGAERVAESAANGSTEASRRAEAWRAVGELRSMRGDVDGARAALRRAIEAAPSTTAAVEAARVLGQLAGVTAEDRLRIGRVYIRHGNYDRGIAGLQAYLDSGQGSVLERAAVRLELGRGLVSAGRYDDAERWLRDVAERAPTATIAADALFQVGRLQYRQGRVEDARATFLRTAQRYPRERAAAEALFLVADMDHDEGRLDSARRLYRRTADIRPGIAQAGLALMRLGGLHYIDGDMAGAAAIFEEYRRNHPRGNLYQQATYWAAKCYLALGDEARARQRLREVRTTDPFSYYGIRAAEQLGAGFWDVPMDASPPHNPAIDADVAAAMVRLDLLRELGREDLVAFEIDRLRHHFADRDGALYALAEAFNARGLTFTGIRLGWEIYGRERAWNLRLLRIIYPFPYQNLIVAEALERGMDPFLIAGLIRQESMFSADIVSPAGAIGLMQIMPPTGRAVAQQIGLDAFEAPLLERPELNIHLGITYLADLLKSYGNRIGPALAAYNAGPHRVSRWSQFPEYADEELFAERIPFAETRNYVKVVQQNARLYAELYGPVADAQDAEG